MLGWSLLKALINYLNYPKWLAFRKCNSHAI